MPNGRIVSALLMLVVIAVPSAPAQSASRQQATGQAIPDLSGIWEAPVVQPPGGKPISDICGESACGNLLQKLGEAPVAHAITVEEPQMLAWAEKKYKAAREGLPDAVPVGREELNPWFSGCMPLGPSELMLAFFDAVEVRQFPDVVLLFFGGDSGESDHAVRRVYMDGREHPASLQPTMMGHSIGKYEGDTLVVDTIAVKGNRWVDLQGHPHTDALHLVERFRRVNRTLEYEVTITDPNAYKNSWKKKIVRELAPPGPRFWDIAECEEFLQMGTHYGAEARSEGRSTRTD